MTKECSVKVSEIRGKQQKLYITELTENERTEITTEKKTGPFIISYALPTEEIK